MKSFKSLPIFLILFFSINGFTEISAQTKMPLTPDIMSDIMEHIEFRYSDIIQTDLTNVENSLSNNFSGNYDPELIAPRPNIRQITKTSISFSWPVVPNVAHIDLHYFNLSTGTMNTIEDILADSVVVNFLSDDSYLFAFQSIGFADEQGNMTLMVADHSFDFIIVDKDILRSDIPFGYMDCGCSTGNITQYNVHRDAFNSIFIPWTTPCVSTKYNLDINLVTTLGANHSVSLDLVHDQESYDAPRVHTLNYCSFPGFDRPYNLGIPDLCETTVTSKGVTLYFDKVDVAFINFTPTVCDCKGSALKDKKQLAENSDKIKLESFPNPMEDYTNINYTLAEAGTLSLSLYDSFSQEVQHLKQNEFHEKGNYNYSLNTKDLPAGMYNCVLQINGRTKITRLLKLRL